MTLRSRNILIVSAVVLATLWISCTRSNAFVPATAQQIQGPEGYTCFAIYDGTSNAAVGGNCLKN